jgi:F0F1-type ATP synthase assembly protein I
MSDEPVEPQGDGEAPDEVARRLEEIQEGVRTERPDFDAEFEERLSALERRAGKVRTRREGQVVEEKRRRELQQSDAKGLGVGLSIAYTIIGLPLVLAGVGWLIDRRLETDLYMGLGMVIGAFAGVMMAFVILNRTQDKS